MTIKIDFEVAYSQLSIFESALSQPFNDWTDQHVAQGFSWRPGSVSFRTVEEAGHHTVHIDIVDHSGALNPDVVRAIEVPFVVPANGAIEIGSVVETVPITLPPGSFLLRCEFLKTVSIYTQQVRLVFSRKDSPRFAIVLADSAISVECELLATAQPASC